MINIIEAPTITFTQPKQVVLLGTEEKRLICTVSDSKPAATVVWLKDNEPIDTRTSEKYYLDDFDLIIVGIDVSRTFNQTINLNVYILFTYKSSIFTHF